MLRRMVDASRDKEEDRKPGGKTLVKQMEIGVKGGGNIGLTKWKIKNIQKKTIPLTTEYHDGNNLIRRRCSTS